MKKVIGISKTKANPTRELIVKTRNLLLGLISRSLLTWLIFPDITIIKGNTERNKPAKSYQLVADIQYGYGKICSTARTMMIASQYANVNVI